MKRQVNLLLIIGSSLTMLLIFFVLFFVIVSITVDQVEERGVGDIHQFRQLVENASTDPPGSTPDYQKLALQHALAGDFHIIIVDMNSYLLADSHDVSGTMMGGRFINANLSAAKEGKTAVSIVRDQRTDNLNIAVGEVLNTVHGTIVVSFGYSTDAMRRLAAALLYFSAGLLLIIAVQIYLLTTYALSRYRRPIRKLLQHTKRATVSRGGFSKISIDTHNPELTQLAEDFNTLIDRYDLLITSDNAKYSKINSLLSHISTGIMIVDPDNSVSLINPRAEELLKIDKGRLFTVTPELVCTGDLFREVMEECKQVNRDRSTRSFTLESENGNLLDISAEAMYSKYTPYGHSGTLVLIRDVTEMRRLERLKDEFVSNVSHELRTPLTVINGFVQTLQSWETLSASDRDTSLTLIEVETERLKKLISELLMFSRIEGEMDKTQRSSFDPIPLLEEVVESLKPVADRKDIAISLNSASPGTLFLNGRITWFKQIASNLLDNAIKYSHESSRVEVRLEAADGGGTLLAVGDRGIGISEEDIPRIFERFYRVEKSRNSKIAGSGLGLSITRLLVEEFHGSIRVDSTPDRGTVFTVHLPFPGETPGDS